MRIILENYKTYLLQKMYRQQQISNRLFKTKDQIKQIDVDIERQNEKQKILNELLKNLNLSSEVEQSSISSISQRSSQVDITELNDRNQNGIKSHASESFSILSEDLSFQIQKIRLFQSNQKIYSHKKKQQHFQKGAKIYKLEEQQNVPQNLIQLDLDKICKKSRQDEGPSLEPRGQALNLHEKQKIQMIFKKQTKPSLHIGDLKQTNFQSNKQRIPQTDLINKAKQNFLLKQQAKNIFIKHSIENEKFRHQSLQKERIAIRQQLLKQKNQRQRTSQIFKQPQTLDKIQSDLLKKYDNFSIDKTIKYMNSEDYSDSDLLNKTRIKTNKYSRYIDKNIQSLNKTQQKIHSFRQYLKKGI